MKALDPQSYNLNEVIYISNKNRYERLHKRDILYIEAQGAYVDIYAINGKKNLSTHLKSFLSQIDDTAFVQVSRKHAVNVIHIQEVLSDSIIIGKQSISTGKMYRNNLLEKLPIIKSKP
jgi:DNA-binding LytR/AlgR family response regulator